MKQIEILGKNKEEINERIQRIENTLPQATLKDGLPFATWDEPGTLSNNMKKMAVPGISIAVINNYKLEWVKSFGVKDIRSPKVNSLRTIFEGGSTAKAITASAVLSAIERNKIGLDDIVNEKLQSWKIPDNENTKEVKVSLKHLLTHTSGINRPESLFGYESGQKPTIEQVLKGESPAKNDPVEVMFVPGSDKLMKCVHRREQTEQNHCA